MKVLGAVLKMASGCLLIVVGGTGLVLYAVLSLKPEPKPIEPMRPKVEEKAVKTPEQGWRRKEPLAEEVAAELQTCLEEEQVIEDECYERTF